MTQNNHENDNELKGGFIAITVAVWDNVEGPTPVEGSSPDSAYAVNVKVSGNMQAVNADLFEALQAFFNQNGVMFDMRTPRPSRPAQ